MAHFIYKNALKLLPYFEKKKFYLIYFCCLTLKCDISHFKVFAEKENKELDLNHHGCNVCAPYKLFLLFLYIYDDIQQTKLFPNVYL